jgi:hypothetical protein
MSSLYDDPFRLYDDVVITYDGDILPGFPIDITYIRLEYEPAPILGASFSTVGRTVTYKQLALDGSRKEAIDRNGSNVLTVSRSGSLNLQISKGGSP